MRVSQGGSLATVPNVCSPYVLWGGKSGKAFLFLWLASPLCTGAKCQARYSLAHSEGGPRLHLEDSWGSGTLHCPTGRDSHCTSVWKLRSGGETFQEDQIDLRPQWVSSNPVLPAARLLSWSWFWIFVSQFIQNRRKSETVHSQR